MSPGPRVGTRSELMVSDRDPDEDAFAEEYGVGGAGGVGGGEEGPALPKPDHLVPHGQAPAVCLGCLLASLTTHS